MHNTNSLSTFNNILAIFGKNSNYFLFNDTTFLFIFLIIVILFTFLNK
jgi:hypothetical protein